MDVRGMTLFELLLAVLIITLLLLVATPLVKDALARLEAQRVTTELMHLCQIARNQAITRRTPVTLCGSANGSHCDANWAEGLLLFVDKNHDRQTSPGEAVLQYTPLRIAPSRLAWEGFSGHTVEVEAMGIPFASNGSFTYCTADKKPAWRRQVIVNRGGRVRHSRDQNGDGIHESVGGGDIVCP